MVLIDPGDRVLLTNPTYSGMAQRVRLAGGEQVFTSLVERDGRWALDLDDLRERARGCRVLFFASPCMPVGTVFTEQETAALVAAARENDAWIVFNGAADKVAFGGYCLLDITATGVAGTEFAAGLLAEENVAVTPMQGWGADDFGKHLVRLIFSNEPEDRLREAGRRIAAFADRLPGANRR